MTLTDPIADMLTRIRNAIMAKKQDVEIPHSRLKAEIAKILKEEGYIYGYKIMKDKVQDVINVSLKYTEDGGNVITGLRRISKPGCRIYCKSDSVPKVLDGLGIVIISTSKGVYTGKKCEELSLGGEVLCQIW